MPFYGTEGIGLGHIISEKGIEVDKAKVELILKLPSPTTVKGVRQFLGHVGFYRRFKRFSRLSKPLCELLAKDAKFVWDERCQRSFDQLKQFLTTAPIESLMLLENTPWYAHIADYLVTGKIPSEWKAQDRKHFFAKIHAYYWEKPFLFKYYADQIIRKCVLKKSNKESSAIAMRVHVETTLPLRKQP
ncbi:hypothetical protein AAG906_027260 [Vitis piasezkii]